MSIVVKFPQEKLEVKENKLYRNHTVSTDTKDVKVYKNLKDGRFILPFSLANLKYKKYILKENKSEPIEFHQPETFDGKLRTLQEDVCKQAIGYLNETGSVIISSEPGFGKTIISVKTTCMINLPTVIFMKQTILMDQWIESFKTFAPSKKVCKISSFKDIEKNDSDVWIINPILLKKISFEESEKIFSRIKFVVVDELHQIISKVLHRALFRIQPKYFLGLSATPYRPSSDPFQPVIEWFFGKNIIGTNLYRKHTVYCVNTNFRPNVKYQKFNHSLDWNSVLTSQAESEKRNELIVSSVCKFPERNWIILVKRVNHATLLKNLFEKQGKVCETITGTKNKFDKSCKILIGTTSKIGVGFDHKPIDALCVAADIVGYFEQFLGRCMRKKDVEPVILDFVDNLPSLRKHFESRIEKYKKCGGSVLTFENNETEKPEDLRKCQMKIPKRRVSK
ncbi:170R [Cherax quadricarinatus iridovirus]|uniref:Helicase n=1 Tax=Shrimp hemocyte iridescent virus TaxID=2039780 RepID=A0A291B0Z6_9VIRU|nr:170R [Cherax quadricarinatus iridovirus]YP_010084909.1 helicase [Shrimp hemocyte iridescent virus]UPA43314.1 helicase [Iridovirus CN01]ASZ85150.1 170R [Cherax quadricarinatus iridovirus]ATE87166.1 helicase [Shrimp hemocyte iridescent virus]UPA43549.1 helicase [Iridovirus CN01]UPA43746.1 helicase [Iridovirus CN01]